MSCIWLKLALLYETPQATMSLEADVWITELPASTLRTVILPHKNGH